MTSIVWKVSIYVVFFGLNTGKYGPEKTPYLDTFHAVEAVFIELFVNLSFLSKCLSFYLDVLNLLMWYFQNILQTWFRVDPIC